MPVALLAVIHATCIAVAGIFSSRVATANNEVLVRSSTCGIPSYKIFDLLNLKQEDLVEENALYVISQYVLQHGQEYVRSCYTSRSKVNSTACNVFTQPRLETRINWNDTCPFQENVCGTAAVTLDSGLIDSDLHLGINAAAPDRIQVRKTLSCAPVPVEKLYSSNWTAESPVPMLPWDPDRGGPGVSFKYYYLGPQMVFGKHLTNFTFVESNYSGSWRTAYTSLYVHNPNVWSSANKAW
jgi:hypothetical protein